MESIFIILYIIQFLLIIYISVSNIYILIFAFASLFKYKIKKTINKNFKRFIILIPAYKEDEVILNVCHLSLLQNYPYDKFEILVIADNLNETTLQKLKESGVKVICVDFENSTKTKALQYAANYITDNEYDTAIILDADNIMEKDFLCKINNSITNENTVIQGHRTAKNINTGYAILDAVSEEINNNIFRKGHRTLGFSAALIGSAIAIDIKLFKKYISEIKAIGGFDKELELILLKNNIKIDYFPDALVYDEKIQDKGSFSKQRKRWLSAQFYYFKKFLPDATYHLITNGNINYFNKALQMMFLPRILLLGLSFLAVCINLLLCNPIFLNLWLINLILICISISISIPKEYYNKKFLYALLSIPSAFFTILLLLFKLKNANKSYIHTQHTINENQKK